MNEEIKREKAALLVPIKGEWITDAFRRFKENKEPLYYFTNSNIGKIESLNANKVYFKCKGETTISVVADFIGITTENPENNRLNGAESDIGKFYYGFQNLKLLDDEVELEELERFESGKNVRNDFPGVCIIKDPEEK